METVDKAWSEQFRAFWADPFGEIVIKKDCGCIEYQLGNGFCEEHFRKIFEGIFNDKE